MTSILKAILCAFLVSVVLTRNLQTVYDVIIIGAGAVGIGASVVLSENNINHMIIQARARFGGRTVATKVDGVDIDLGASFVHSPGSSNAIDSYVKKLGITTTPASFSNSETLYKSGASVSGADQSTAQIVYSAFQTYVGQNVATGNDKSLKTLWDEYQATVMSSYSSDARNKAFYQLVLEANLNGGDLDTISGLAYSSQSGKSSDDYLPGPTYANVIDQIYKTYCKNTPILYNKPVTNIDYSGSEVKITTSTGQVYNAKKVINTIPLGVLKSGSVTFTPALPAAYTTAIDSIGFGIFNKIIVTLNGTFWQSDSTRVGNLYYAPHQTAEFPQFYIVPSNPKLLIFFVSGTKSKDLNTQKSTDAELIAYLKTVIQAYDSKNQNLDILKYEVTRWEAEPYSLGSYSYWKVGTTSEHYKTLSTNIDNKLWFAGEHVHPTQASNVHGAFQTGVWAAQSMIPAAQWWLLLASVSLWMLFSF